jgi:hypothetical protein
MKGTPAIYLGRIVEKKHFRAFVHGSNGEKKLVESWEAFEAAMQSGIWFASLEDAQAMKEIALEAEANKLDEKPKSKPKPKPKSKPAKVEEVEEPSDPVENDGMVFEVTDENK